MRGAISPFPAIRARTCFFFFCISISHPVFFQGPGAGATALFDPFCIHSRACIFSDLLISIFHSFRDSALCRAGESGPIVHPIWALTLVRRTRYRRLAAAAPVIGQEALAGYASCKM